MGNSFFLKREMSDYQGGEFLCSVVPCLVLVFQILPSLSLLYFFGVMSFESVFSVKVIGHQWYWSYDYSDVSFLVFDSFIKRQDSLLLGDSRLLETDNRFVVPCESDIRFCVSSSDVLHAWAINGMGIKLDAMGGIISVLNYNFPVVGVFFGQCSEICGANHSFIPIVLEVCPFSLFKLWCLNFLF